MKPRESKIFLGFFDHEIHIFELPAAMIRKYTYEKFTTAF